MVVGAGNVVLSQPRAVAAGGAGVQASGRRCAVAAGTPLAALVALHAQGGPAFAIRDYGHCNSSARNSGQLFVYSLDGETNHGQNGWEYKVGNLAGSAGAADPSGPQGDGRLLRAGQRVLWFWCEAYAGGCERTLEVSAASSVARGGRLAVRVTGYENEGRGVAMAGATVRLGSSSASTGALRHGDAHGALGGRPLRLERVALRLGARVPRDRHGAVRIAAVQLIALAGVLALAGCGLGAGPAPRAVSVLVTREFGSQVVHDTPHPHTAGQETVMSLLLRNYPVSTRYGGGFVQSISGASGGTHAGHPLDWFYYVNGVQAAKGAAATDVHPGDHVWWDLHDWSQTEEVPAVVGSFPEPFLNGLDGRRLPVRVECGRASRHRAKR